MQQHRAVLRTVYVLVKHCSDKTCYSQLHCFNALVDECHLTKHHRALPLLFLNAQISPNAVCPKWKLCPKATEISRAASGRCGFNSPEEELLWPKLLGQARTAYIPLQFPYPKFPVGWNEVCRHFLGYSHLDQSFLVVKYERRKYHTVYFPLWTACLFSLTVFQSVSFNINESQ